MNKVFIWALGLGLALSLALTDPSVAQQRNSQGSGSGCMSLTTCPGTVAWSNITSTPTTLAGYGITNGATLGANTFTGLQTINTSTAPQFSSSTALLAGQKADGAVAAFALISSGTSTQYGSVRTDGTFASPTGLVANDIIGTYTSAGYDGSAVSGAAVTLNTLATGTWSGSNHEAKFQIKATPTSSTTLETEATFQGGFASGTGTPQGVGTDNAPNGFYVGSNQIVSSGRAGALATLALGGCTIGTNALCVTGTVSTMASVTATNFVGTVYGDTSSFGNNAFQITGSTGIATEWNGGAFAFSPTAMSTGSPDVILTRGGPATLQLGAAAAASPQPQTLQVQPVVTGTLNTAGALWTFTDSVGTGTGASGGYQWDTAAAGSSGSTPNTEASTMALSSTLLTLAVPIKLASSTTGAGTETFTNSPCTGLTTEQWIPVQITGQTGTWYVPACQ